MYKSFEILLILSTSTLSNSTLCKLKNPLHSADSSPVALVEGACRRALGEGNANNEEATGKSGIQNGDRCNGGRRR